MKFKKAIILILSLVFLYSCGLEGALQGKKRSENSDEFLVEKKNPLAMPPDYEKLPTPGSEKVSPETFSQSSDVKDLLNIEESNSSTDGNDSSGDIESSIIEKIQ